MGAQVTSLGTADICADSGTWGKLLQILALGMLDGYVGTAGAEALAPSYPDTDEDDRFELDMAGCASVAGSKGYW